MTLIEICALLGRFQGIGVMEESKRPGIVFRKSTNFLRELLEGTGPSGSMLNWWRLIRMCHLDCDCTGRLFSPERPSPIGAWIEDCSGGSCA